MQYPDLGYTKSQPTDRGPDRLQCSPALLLAVFVRRSAPRNAPRPSSRPSPASIAFHARSCRISSGAVKAMVVGFSRRLGLGLLSCGSHGTIGLNGLRTQLETTTSFCAIRPPRVFSECSF